MIKFNLTNLSHRVGVKYNHKFGRFTMLLLLSTITWISEYCNRVFDHYFHEIDFFAHNLQMVIINHVFDDIIILCFDVTIGNVLDNLNTKEKNVIQDSHNRQWFTLFKAERRVCGGSVSRRRTFRERTQTLSSLIREIRNCIDARPLPFQPESTNYQRSNFRLSFTYVCIN